MTDDLYLDIIIFSVITHSITSILFTLNKYKKSNILKTELYLLPFS